MTAGTRDYPDIVGGKYANQPELDQDMQTVRQTAALERIATALEQLALQLMPSDLAAFHASAPRTAPEPRAAQNGPSDPEPPYPVPVLAPSAPVPQAPFPAMTPNWQAGMVHQNGHNPLKTNSRGLYCPTRMENEEWCKWHA